VTPYQADIGLEVHVELATRTKMFCACQVVDTTLTAPNTSVCPVCCGMPGTLPVINRNAVALALRAALGLNCRIAETSIFARKNYFYPDLPKGYQISQYEQPLAEAGTLAIQTAAGEKTVRIRRAHLEEDTGKLTHISEDGDVFSLVDLNRAGVPLLEIVSEPDMHSVEEVRAYSRELRRLLRWLDVTSGDMEKGTMRFEANLSMRQEDCPTLGTRVEIKNLNSFRAMELAILYQMESQQAALERGEKVAQQTLGWNESKGITEPQRSKEEANDYRYFPEPDLPPLHVDQAWLDAVRKDMPELPRARQLRYQKDYGLTDYDCERLLEDRIVSQFFEDCLQAAPVLEPKSIANWLLTDLFAGLNMQGTSIADLVITPAMFTELITQVESGAINQSTGKEVLAEMLVRGETADVIIAEKGLQQISDAETIRVLVEKVLADHPAEVKYYLGGKETVINWLFGQVMRESQGKGNPQVVRKELHDQLDHMKSPDNRFSHVA
jgi:aspartyl-tRNA(Asn)/glutamyl-tRNA(Gln) amidotransferase subunit B